MVSNSGKIIEMLGGLAIIASLLFVAYEIRQSNRIAVGTTSYEIQRNWMAINDLLATDEELGAVVIKLFDDDIELSPAERFQADAYVRRFINTWAAIEDAYDNGLVSDALYQMAIDEVHSFSRSQKVKESFKRFASTYDMAEFEVLAPLADL